MTCRTLKIGGFSLQQLAKDKSTVVHVRQMINNEQKSKILCRVCKSKAKLTGLLYRCESSSCGAVHWDKGKVKKLKQKFVENEALLLLARRQGDIRRQSFKMTPGITLQMATRQTPPFRGVVLSSAGCKEYLFNR